MIVTIDTGEKTITVKEATWKELDTIRMAYEDYRIIGEMTYQPYHYNPTPFYYGTGAVPKVDFTTNSSS